MSLYGPQEAGSHHSWPEYPQSCPYLGSILIQNELLAFSHTTSGNQTGLSRKVVTGI